MSHNKFFKSKVKYYSTLSAPNICGSCQIKGNLSKLYIYTYVCVYIYIYIYIYICRDLFPKIVLEKIQFWEAQGPKFLWGREREAVIPDYLISHELAIFANPFIPYKKAFILQQEHCNHQNTAFAL